MAKRPVKKTVAKEPQRVAFPPTFFQFVILLLFYFGLHTIVRGLASETAGIDDCDQIVRAQAWSWGYGPQPPLYTWLLKIFLEGFGYTIFSVTALKEIFLFGIYLLTYFTTRLLTKSHLCALAAAIALQFNPSISWESHRELTHSILTSMFVIATIYCFVQFKTGRWKYYLLAGACVALGILSKYNFAIFFVSLFSAGLTTRDFRPLLLNRKMLVGIVLALLICAPHFYWISQNQELAFSSMYKFKMEQTQSWLTVVPRSLFKWVVDLVAHIGPVVAILALVFRRSLRSTRIYSPDETMLWRTFLWTLGIVTASILIFKVTGFRDRWLQPLFVWLPILLIAGFREAAEKQIKVICYLGGCIAIVVLTLAPSRLLFTEKLNRDEILNTPYRRFARDLQPALENADTIIAENYEIAGNLRLRFPSKFVVSPEFADLFPHVEGRGVLVWNAEMEFNPPKQLVDFARAETGKTVSGTVWHFQELLTYTHGRWMRLGAAALE